MFSIFFFPTVVRVALPHPLTFFVNQTDKEAALTLPNEPELATAMRCVYTYDETRRSATTRISEAMPDVPLQPSGLHSFQGDFKRFNFVDGTWVFVSELMARAFTSGGKSISKERVLELFGANVLVLGPDTNPKYAHRDAKGAVDGSTQWIYYNEDVSAFLKPQESCVE